MAVLDHLSASFTDSQNIVRICAESVQLFRNQEQQRAWNVIVRACHAYLARFVADICQITGVFLWILPIPSKS
jgi:hypothetical protein